MVWYWTSFLWQSMCHNTELANAQGFDHKKRFAAQSDSRDQIPRIRQLGVVAHRLPKK